MEKSADKRYQTAGDFADDLRHFVAGEPIQARRSRPLGRIWRKVKRNPAFTAVTLISIAAATLLVSSKFPPAPVPPGPSQPTIQTATFITSPENAILHIYPRDRVTGEPQYAEGIRPEGVTPLTMDLTSGRYLVLAVLPDGRFHEVYRHIPDAPSAVPERYPHERWEVKDDGTVELPPINIPSDDVPDGMVFVKGRENFRVGVLGSQVLPQHSREVTDFLVDPCEVTMGDYKQVTGGHLPTMFKGRTNFPTDDFPVTEIFVDEAIAYAERIGKRLITEFEYEYVATWWTEPFLIPGFTDCFPTPAK